VTPNAVIIPSCGSNLASLKFALDRLGVSVPLTEDHARIRAASHVILPGVGAAADAMERLRLHGLHTLIPRLTQPVLGICLGMQLLYQASEESGAQCLGTIAGTVRRLRPVPGRPVPHMGWNQIRRAAEVELLAGVEDGAHAYFVHSYALPVGSETVAVTDYGEEYSAVIAHRNFFGTQFHPERSAQTGATILGNFLAMH
jgi:glutamine amidotransferase